MAYQTLMVYLMQKLDSSVNILLQEKKERGIEKEREE